MVSLSAGVIGAARGLGAVVRCDAADYTLGSSLLGFPGSGVKGSSSAGGLSWLQGGLTIGVLVHGASDLADAPELEVILLPPSSQLMRTQASSLPGLPLLPAPSPGMGRGGGHGERLHCA